MTRIMPCVLTLTTLLACGDDSTPVTDVTIDTSVAADVDQDAPETATPDVPDASAPADAADVADVVNPAPPSWDPALHPWPMYGHDNRRTNRSPFVGPQSYTPSSPRNWRYQAQGGASINMQATVTASGVYFGTWGVLRRESDMTPSDQWTKSDGRYHGLNLDGSERFTPVDPRPVHACYRFPGHTKGEIDTNWCGADNDWLVTFYNGTIEGTALVDPFTGLHYVGRGDGALYAIHPDTGAVEWIFDTFNPEDAADPDGGGEVVGGAVMDPRGLLYIATAGIPWPGDDDQEARETQAVYAVDRAGQLVWRYPSSDANLDNTVFAAPALSPDGDRLYVATFLSDTRVPGQLLAFDLSVAPDAPDSERLAWSLPLINDAHALKPRLWTRYISVGADGSVYLGAAEQKLLGVVAAVVAVEDQGDRGVIRWISEPHGYPDSPAHLVQGLALWEEGGETLRIYAATAHARSANGSRAGLFALDPATGAVIGSFDPGAESEPAIGTLTGPILDEGETIYVGARGRHDLVASADAPNSQWRDGHMFALRFDPAAGAFSVVWRMQVEGQLDWVSPAIGADGVMYFGSTASFTPLEAIQWHAPTELTPHSNPWFYAIAD